MKHLYPIKICLWIESQLEFQRFNRPKVLCEFDLMIGFMEVTLNEFFLGFDHCSPMFMTLQLVFIDSHSSI